MSDDTTTTTTTERCDMTAGDVVQSLTGWEEDDIARQWGGKVQDLAETDKNRLLRALYYVCRKRRGDTGKEAYKRTMDTSIQAVADYFPDPPEGSDEDEAAQGKDES